MAVHKVGIPRVFERVGCLSFPVAAIDVLKRAQRAACGFAHRLVLTALVLVDVAPRLSTEFFPGACADYSPFSQRPFCYSSVVRLAPCLPVVVWEPPNLAVAVAERPSTSYL